MSYIYIPQFNGPIDPRRAKIALIILCAVFTAIIWAALLQVPEKPQAMSEEEIQQIADTFDPVTDEVPTVLQAQAMLHVSMKKRARAEQERQDLQPRDFSDCRPSWNNLSPAEQIRRVNEVLNTPNEPPESLK